ncbi:hypothetical protein R1flu_020411 [Riccia fluitans]|uniref:Uncharacterized protein n=1 Tax=Riccia fluitans TaxID=41844 RepID=A0ABD1ZLF3_9MARC
MEVLVYINIHLPLQYGSNYLTTLWDLSTFGTLGVGGTLVCLVDSLTSGRPSPALSQGNVKSEGLSLWGMEVPEEAMGNYRPSR